LRGRANHDRRYPQGRAARRIDVREGDALDVEDLSDVSVVLLYISDHFNMLIRPVLWREPCGMECRVHEPTSKPNRADRSAR